jgi:alpha-amylase
MPEHLSVPIEANWWDTILRESHSHLPSSSGFEWYVPDDHQHWKRLARALPSLKMTGIDNLWIPPGCKASSPSGNGYDVYDLFDLGEFDAKGSVGTKWGTKKELEELVKKANEVGIGIYWDAVLNHKAAADSTEKCRAVEVDPGSALPPSPPLLIFISLT